MAYSPTAGVFVNGQVIDAIDFNTEFALVSVGMAEDVTLLNQAIIDAINDLIANGADDFVMLVGSQDIPGAKTFNGGLEMSSTAPDLKVTNTVANDATGSRLSLLESTGNDGGMIQHDGAANEIKIIGLNGGVETDHVVIDRVTGDTLFSGVPATTAVQGATTGSLTRRDYVDGLDAANVKLTGNQTIGGTKTFSAATHIHASGASLTLQGLGDSTTNTCFMEFEEADSTRNGWVGFGSPSHSDMTLFNDIGDVYITKPHSFDVQGLDVAALTRKDYVDAAIATLDGDVVKLTGNQTVTGEKTFSTNPKSSAIQSTASDALTRKDYVDGLDGANVKLTGNQTVAGEKTFSTNPKSSAVQSTASNAVTRKDYVDGLDGANVKLTGNQTVDGTKTFTSSVTFNDLPKINTHATDHGYLQYFTQQSSPGSRTAYVGYGGAGTTQFDIRNELGGNVSLSNPISNNVQVAIAAALTRKDYVDGLDGANVKLTGNQTVAGEKTYSLNIIQSSQPTNVAHLTRKDYVDGLDVQNVKLTGTQTIGGAKTFSTNPKSTAAQDSSTTALTRKDYVDGLDTANVKLTGTQTITGSKTYSLNIIQSSQPTNVAHLTRKDYVDGLDTANVKLTGTQTIGGFKTFSDGIRVIGGGGSATLRGVGDSTTNTCFVEYEQANGTRNGWVGFGSSGHSDMNVFNDVGDVFITNPRSSDVQGTEADALTRKDYVDAQVSPKIEATDYATSTVGGTVKMRVSGTDLFITNDGSTA